MSLYKLVSLLLDYPDAELLEARAEVAAAAAQLPDSPAATAVRRFAAWYAAASPAELQAGYVQTFDFAKRSTLFLSFHSHGDRRQRGMAMLGLKRRYRAAGFPLAEGQLPDYLPAVLEFAAVCPEHGGEVLAELRPAIELVRAALREEDSPYADLLDAVCLSLPRLSERQRERAAEMALAGPPTEQVGLEPFAPPEVMPISHSEGRR